VYLFIFYSETTTILNISEQWVGILIAIILVNLVGLGMNSINTILTKFISWNKNITLRLFVEVSLGVVLTSIAGIVFIFLFVYQIYENQEVNFFDFIIDGSIKFGILSLVIIYGYSLINFSIYSYNQYNVGQIEALTSDRLQLDLRFEALKSQLNPHFLFNALNTISSLIYLDIKQAEKYIRQLARTYDYILKTDETRLVSFQGELEMVEAYFFMHKIRYEDCISLHIDNNLHDLSGYIPPFVLQILVENALKHTVISEHNPLKIEIFSKDKKQLVIRNNIVKKLDSESSINIMFNKEKALESYKIGLSNIRKRYMFLTNKNIEITSDTHFTIKIPIIAEAYER